jgi:hypothetical protein
MVGAYHEVVLDVHPCAHAEFFKPHTIKKALVDPTNHTTAKSRGEKNIGVRNLERIAKALGINSRDLL